MKLKLLALCGLLSGTAAAQLPLGFDRLSPESSPAFIGEDTFTTLSHPDPSNHVSVRIKKTKGWCDPDVRSYTGYIDAGPRHLFFYYFDSRKAPSTSPLVLWTNGGPGCSSSMGAFMELGPCTTQPDGNSTERNPYSWTEEANMIFIDQPVGVGFSYSDSGIHVATTEQAALDVHAFLTIFFDAFTEFRDRPFHLSGESYGGRYLPVFASEIVYQNSLLKKKNSTTAPINLKSVMIGNGLTDVVTMTTSYYDQACTSSNGIGKPVLNIKACIEMQQTVKRCDAWLERVCRTNLVQPECDIASEWCQEQLQLPFLYGEINPYDISKPCTTLNEDLCYSATSVIKTYLDQPWVREMLGVDPGLGPFQSCSNKVGRAFGEAKDGLAPTFYHLTGLLENDVRVLIYVGVQDWICNYIGNFRMIEALEWSGKDAFVAEELRDWKTSGEVSGQTKAYGGLTWSTIYGAGHMVPLDKPAESLAMVNRWLTEKKL